MFEAQNPFRVGDVMDGLSNTAMMSESILGDGAENGGAPRPTAARRFTFMPASA